ncbi:MAG: T9SS type A sorting domain-containing protein [Candidatus Delongbacteria bacterium]|nr:T9SS type A sorting domain-containing protein [Candidatus Delongbacteria bacterium]
MKKWSLIGLALMMVSVWITGAAAQGRWNDHGKGRHQGDSLLRDSLTWIETSGRVVLDTSAYRDLYLLDSDDDGIPEYLLNFGPRWMNQDSIVKPGDGETASVKGYLHTRFRNLRWEEIEQAIEVVELNGVIIRDTANWFCDSCSHVFNRHHGRKIKDPNGGFGHYRLLDIDSLQSFKGVVMTDTSLLKHRTVYLLDIDADSEADYLLGLGRRHNNTTNGYPVDGDTVTLDGVVREETYCGLDLPLIVVVNLNGVAWRTFPATGDDSTLVTVKNRSRLQAVCYPNPFNPTITISFTLTEPSQTEVVIYNITGRKVKTLNHSYLNAGEYRYQWDGMDEHGGKAAAGTYFSVIKTDQETQSRKIIFLK